MLRASYGRTMETPYNENLLLSGAMALEWRSLAAAHRCRRASATRSKWVPSAALAAGSWPTRLLRQEHRQQLRFQRPVQHADRVSDFVGAFAHLRLRRQGQPRRTRRLQRVRRIRDHECDLLAAGTGRYPGRRLRRATSGSTTIRSSIQRRTCSTSSTNRWALGRPRLAVRFRSGS